MSNAQNNNEMTISFTKIVTIIEGNRVYSIRKKSDFWKAVDSFSSFRLTASHNHKQIISKLEAKGFNLEINNDYGFDFDIEIFASK